jgi:hypothetical protein
MPPYKNAGVLLQQGAAVSKPLKRKGALESAPPCFSAHICRHFDPIERLA